MRYFISFIVLLTLVSGISSHAATEIANPADRSNWYQVELFVFAQTHPATNESWDGSLLPHYDNQAIHLSTDTSTGPQLPADANSTIQQAVAKGAWKLLSKDDSQPLADMARKMMASSNYRALFYGRWQQPIDDTDQSLPVYVQGGNLLTTNIVAALPVPMTGNTAGTNTAMAPPTTTNGTVSDDAANEAYSKGVVSNTSSGTSGNPPQAPGQTVTTTPETTPASLPELQGTLSLSRSHYLHLDTNLWFASLGANGQPFFVHIDEGRRLKDGELHYLDNPLFGVLIRVTPMATNTSTTDTNTDANTRVKTSTTQSRPQG
jgi:hypothetical protein